MTDQASLFGPSPTPNVKAKALPKVRPRPAAPRSTLTPEQQKEAATNVAKLVASRQRLEVGALEMADGACDECGGERIRELIDISPGGCRLWEARCLKCQMDK